MQFQETPTTPNRFIRIPRYPNQEKDTEIQDYVEFTLSKETPLQKGESNCENIHKALGTGSKNCKFAAQFPHVHNQECKKLQNFLKFCVYIQEGIFVLFTIML